MISPLELPILILVFIYYSPALRKISPNSIIAAMQRGISMKAVFNMLLAVVLFAQNLGLKNRNKE